MSNKRMNKLKSICYMKHYIAVKSKLKTTCINMKHLYNKGQCGIGIGGGIKKHAEQCCVLFIDTLVDRNKYKNMHRKEILNSSFLLTIKCKEENGKRERCCKYINCGILTYTKLRAKDPQLHTTWVTVTNI